MARDITRVIKMVISELEQVSPISCEYGKTGLLIDRLNRISHNSMYRPPEAKNDLWGELSVLLGNELGDPSTAAWKQRVSDIVEGRIIHEDDFDLTPDQYERKKAEETKGG